MFTDILDTLNPMGFHHKISLCSIIYLPSSPQASRTNNVEWQHSNCRFETDNVFTEIVGVQDLKHDNVQIVVS